METDCVFIISQGELRQAIWAYFSRSIPNNAVLIVGDKSIGDVPLVFKWSEKTSAEKKT